MPHMKRDGDNASEKGCEDLSNEVSLRKASSANYNVRENKIYFRTASFAYICVATAKGRHVPLKYFHRDYILIKK